MGSSSPSELTLDCKPHSYSMLLKSFGDLQAASHHHDQSQNHTQKLEDFLSRLEEERLKIDAFKRELPLSMQLLTTAVEASRQQLQAFRANNEGPNRPVLEEFIPLKHSPIEGSEKTTNTIITSDKANWMTSAQLWSQASLDTNNNNNNVTKPDHQSLTSPTDTSTDIGFQVSPKLALLDSKQHRPSSTTYVGGGAFLPFSKDHRPNPTLRPLPELALASPDQKNNNINNNNNNKTAEILLEDKMNNNKSSCDSEGNNYEQGNKLGNGIIHSSNMPEGQQTQANTASAATTTANNTSQTHRKARRCWSPDLHRRFVNALQMLGGSQVATPKQIRELMKVDGLTNDEVKSHLQKYRLHTRRPSPSPQVGGGPTPQLVVLGGIWVPPEYASAAHNGPTALYSPHPGSHAPTHYCATPMPQDFYTTQPPQQQQQQLHHHTLHHQLHVYRTSTGSHTHSSPESDGRGAGGRSESIEDGKSDSSSWKGAESGGDQIQMNNGVLAGRRSEDGDDSNGSQITLKF